MTTKTKAKPRTKSTSKKATGILLLKRVAYFAMAAVPVYFIFKHKAAVTAAAILAYDQISEVVSDVGQELAEQAEVIIDKVKDLDIV
jgi:hypothetical protein